jgi:hypothetical protein
LDADKSPVDHSRQRHVRRRVSPTGWQEDPDLLEAGCLDGLPSGR